MSIVYTIQPGPGLIKNYFEVNLFCGISMPILTSNRAICPPYLWNPRRRLRHKNEIRDFWKDWGKKRNSDMLESNSVLDTKRSCEVIESMMVDKQDIRKKGVIARVSMPSPLN